MRLKQEEIYVRREDTEKHRVVKTEQIILAVRLHHRQRHAGNGN